MLGDECIYKVVIYGPVFFFFFHMDKQGQVYAICSMLNIPLHSLQIDIILSDAQYFIYNLTIIISWLVCS